MIAPTILERASAYVGVCPPAVSGQRGHDQTFAIAVALVHGFALGEADALALLREFNARCLPPWSEAELLHKVRQAFSVSHSRPRGYLVGSPLTGWANAPAKPTATQPVHVPTARRWPAVNDELRAAVVADGPGLVDLWEVSPLRFDDNNSHTEELVDAMFPGNPLLCCGKNARKFATRTRDEWRGHLASQALIVPNFMSALTGLTRDGRTSAHTLANTGPRRFLVVEFDTGSFDDHAALLAHLGSRAPLTVAVHSGHKSLHGWFYCADQPEARVLKFFRYAVSLGADPALWTRSQFARMPDGTRDDGKPQRAFYFNPRTLKHEHTIR